MVTDGDKCFEVYKKTSTVRQWEKKNNVTFIRNRPGDDKTWEVPEVELKGIKIYPAFQDNGTGKINPIFPGRDDALPCATHHRGQKLAEMMIMME